MNLALVTPEKAIKLAANDFLRQLLLGDGYGRAAAPCLRADSRTRALAGLGRGTDRGGAAGLGEFWTDG